MNTVNDYDWKYCSVGGVVRVNIEKGEDIAHLGELDQKLWTALSCPVAGLEMDPVTLAMLDTDCDGKIRVPEVVAASAWLTDIVSDNNLLLKGESFFALDKFNLQSPVGKRLHDSARQILANLGLEKDSISLDDTKDETAIFAKTSLNGDGIITVSSVKDPELAKTVEAVIATQGSVTDRSGAPGIDAARIESFYADLTAYSAWMAEGSASAVKPFGDETEAALAALDAVKDKIDDYFMRCSLVGFDEAAASVLDVSVEKLGAISGGNLASCTDEIALQPIARPSKDCVLRLDAVNPAWKTRVDAFRGQTPGDELTQEQWLAAQSRFEAFKSWKASGKGQSVASLGLDAVNAFISSDAKSALLQTVEADKALEQEANSIREVDRFLHIYRDFYQLLRNFVIFSDFYSRNPDTPAIFEAGQLYIDQRCCKLCIKVSDMGAHADMPSLSGMFLIYCHCSHKSRPGAFDVVAVMTDGGTKDLRPGKNAVFYDRAGNDWDAVVTKIVDNPISVKSAFWSPYCKFWEFCVGIINKSAADKESKAASDLQSVASAANPSEAKKQAFDIAKFAGIFAALGMGLGMLASAVTDVCKGIVALEWWQLFALVAGIIIVISGPSCFIAWTKLRKRNLGPVLNANGWAINSVVLVNVPFGGTLTTTAKYPHLRLDDPFVRKTPAWKKMLRWFAAVVVIAGAALYFTDNLEFVGIHRNADKSVSCPSELVDSGLQTSEDAASDSSSQTVSEQQ